MPGGARPEMFGGGCELKKRKRWLLPVALAAVLVAFFFYKMTVRINTDSKAPEITMSEGTLQVSVYDETGLLQGITAWDTRDGDVTDLIVVESVYMGEEERATVTYAAFDRSGNVSKAQRQVVFTDYRSPRLTLSSPLLFPYGSGVNVMNLVGAEDLLDGSINRRVRASVVTDKTLTMAGTHQIEFRVTNSMGDTSKAVLPVEVYEEDYNAVLTLKTYLVYLKVGESFNARSYLDEFTYRVNTLSFTGSEADPQVSITGTVNTAVAGVYAVKYVASLTEERMDYQGVSKLIVIVEE